MNLSWIDWSVVAVVVGFLVVMAVITNKYTTSVADFLAANRCAGRYMLTMSEAMAGIGVITVIANFEKFYQSGFAASWWGIMLSPIAMIITLSGWIIYRYRETRAMTIGQFFEIRYSKRFRIFSGMLAWGAGVVNYGIFPAVTARFFIYFCGIPKYVIPVGNLELNVTLGVVMFVLLAIAIMFTFLGGQIAVLVTDFLQGQFFCIVCLAIMVLLFWEFGWSNIIDVLKRAPEGQSLLNPFDQGDIPDFTFSFFAMYAFLVFYGVMAWQGNQGYNCSAKNPHEARMSKILGTWRGMVYHLIIMLLPICAYVLLHSDLFPEQASGVNGILNTIENQQIRSQILVPVALTKILPVGFMGLFCAAMLGAAISTDDSYLHSWGSIFIQDVVLPLRKTPLTTKQHMKLLRKSILGVAVFAWIFSMLFPLNDYIFMFFQITGAIYLGGAGAVIIGGLYWKRSTTAGAWAGMVTGSLLAVSSIVLRNIIWVYFLPDFKASHLDWSWLQNLPEEFPYNGMEMSFVVSLIAVVVFVVVSLLTKPDPNFNMEQMLHRGKYEITGDHKHIDSKPQKGLKKLFGITDEFTKGDKIIYLVTILWSVFWFVAFVVGVVYVLLFGSSDEGWSKWWLFQVVLTFIVGLISVVWLLWGGLRDMKDLFRSLSMASRNIEDDGSIEGHRSVAIEIEDECQKSCER